MPTMNKEATPHGRVHNFSAGPSALPLPVLERIQREMLNLPGSGASVLEISHRSKAFARILDEAEADLKRLLGFGDGHKALFLQGGASQQFAMAPMNLAAEQKAGYLVTGSWGKKALKEAKRAARAEALWIGEEGKFRSLPKAGDYSAEGLAYLHCTSNETIQGVQFDAMPHAGGAPLVCDMSSDFLSRPIEADRFGLIYAGAQKNVGPAGLTVVLIRKDLLDRAPEKLPAIFKYGTHVDGNSCYNTPPVFGVYAAGLVFKWLLETYGDLKAVDKANAAKAALLYDAIDGSEGFYAGHADRDCRSKMNVTWTLAEPALETEFLKGAAERKLAGLKGHRSVGGLRASIYNAVPRASVEALAAFMAEFRRGR